MEQSPLCYAVLKYTHSLIGAREEKREKMREKEGQGKIVARNHLKRTDDKQALSDARTNAFLHGRLVFSKSIRQQKPTDQSHERLIFLKSAKRREYHVSQDR